MLYFCKGSQSTEISSTELREVILETLESIGRKEKVLAIPPDITRHHSRAGEITRYVFEYYRENLTHILPSLGTHNPMTADEISTMFRDVPLTLFHNHDWRHDVRIIGKVPPEFIYTVSEGALRYEWEVQVNKLLLDGNFDLILSIGQVVPHEVIGMANFNKNIFIGTGGPEAINKSHYLGAVYGMEKIMGKPDTPVRKVLNYASEEFADHFPQIIYILTVIGSNDEDELVIRGLYIGDDQECFYRAAELSRMVNIQMLEKPISKCIVYLDPTEYRSTWLGNKAIYRSRMAMADGGELVILAPGVKTFGEDKEIDILIRKYGYRGTPATIAATDNSDLQKNLGAAAHLIHGSSENRFQITYCTGKLSKKDILGVNFRYADAKDMMSKYDPVKLKQGYNHLPDGEDIYYIQNPGLGLWSLKSKFH